MLLDTLAVHRLTRLITKDDLTKTPRAFIIAAAYGGNVSDKDWERQVELDDDPPKLATLVTCRWCASVWVAFGVVLVRRRRWWAPVRDALALSSAATLIARLESE